MVRDYSIWKINKHENGYQNLYSCTYFSCECGVSEIFLWFFSCYVNLDFEANV